MAKLKLNAVGKGLFVKRDDVKTASGIILTGDEKAFTGVIISKGKDVKEKINVGDRVIFSHYNFEEYSVEGETFIALQESAVFGKLL